MPVPHKIRGDALLTELRVCVYRGMQDCFRQYPEIYGSELADEDDEAEGPAPTIEGASAAGSTDAPAVADRDQAPEPVQAKIEPALSSPKQPTEAAEQATRAEVDPNVTTKAFDATAANDEKKDSSE